MERNCTWWMMIIVLPDFASFGIDFNIFIIALVLARDEAGLKWHMGVRAPIKNKYHGSVC
jgi:hypothetical protein